MHIAKYSMKTKNISKQNSMYIIKNNVWINMCVCVCAYLFLILCQIYLKNNVLVYKMKDPLVKTISC